MATLVTIVGASVEGGPVYEVQGLDMPPVWAGQQAIIGEVYPVQPVQVATVDEPEPTPLPATPATEPEPQPVATQAPETGSAEGTICTIWHSLPCSYILAVARCESGPDYYVDPTEGYYIGTFQLDPGLHGWRFLAHGWSIWTNGYNVYENSVVAYELYLDNGMAPWPVCRYS